MVISETGAQGHILHPAVRPGKKLLRTVNPKLLHIIGKTNLHLLFEKITEIGRIHLRRICRILEADLLFIMFPDKLQCLFTAAEIPSGTTSSPPAKSSEIQEFPFSRNSSKSSISSYQIGSFSRPAVWFSFLSHCTRSLPSV